MADPSRGDWQCPNEQCHNHINYPNAYVYGSSINCKKCGTGKAAQRAGDWCCPNPQCVNQKNCVYGSKSICPKCGCPKPAAGMGKGGAWMPVSMGKGMGGPPMQALPMNGGVPPARPGDWHCSNAECKNHTANVVYGSKTACPVCGTAKPVSPVMAATFVNHVNPYVGATGFNSRPGDWNCPNPSCKNHVDNVVYGSKDHCPLCDTPKPVGAGAHGMAMRMGGGVAMRPGDWHCENPNCKNHTDNVVYASKTHCPLCNSPNPALDGERLRSRSPRA
mmetsp:Transcript_12913/g.17415  ORF Transcript_12913/g.17415 Transcript_12913/m.17415 type:complete len:276 (+) Transcript_12913:47-874(+)